MTTIRTHPAHRFAVSDVVAGVSVAFVLVPQALAYAELAGLPGSHGLYAAGLPLVAAAFFASSPYIQTGPVALTALLTLGALTPLASPGSAEYVGLAALLALVVGAVRIAVGLLNAGWLSYLMSRPLLTGFTSAAAILIVASQIPAAFGVDVGEAGVLAGAVRALADPGAWEPAAIVLAVGTVALVVVAPRVHPLFPGVLLAALAGLVYSVVTRYAGATVGPIPSAVPPFSLALPWSELPRLVLPGTVIALVGFAEAVSISRSYAAQDGHRWDPDREFLGQGVANIVSGVSGGFPVGASFGRSSVSRLSGARSRWAGLVTGLVMLAFLPFAGVLAPIPVAVLAGIVIGAVWTLIRPGELLRLWPASRPQAAVGWGTFALTILLAPHIEQALVLGLLGAAAVHLWREMDPRVKGRREGNELHVEVGGVLWFGSMPAFDDELLARVAEEPGITGVTVHCGGLGRIDLTAALALADLEAQMRSAGLRLSLADVPPHARRVLGAAGVSAAGGGGNDAG